MVPDSGLQTGELLDILELLATPIALVDNHGVIRHTSVAWRIQSASIGFNLLPGVALAAVHAELSQAAEAVLNRQQTTMELELGKGLHQFRCTLRPCRFAGSQGLLLELNACHDTSGEALHMQEIAGALRDREMQFAAIAANLPGILYRVVLQRDGTISFPYISPGQERSGHTTSEHWLDRIHPEDREQFFEVLRSSASQLLPFDLEQRVMGVGNEELWVRNITRPHQRADGTVVWDGMVLDITAQKRIELDLQHSVQEKVALLQEVHHRVKNNLQIMSSLLDLQALTSLDPVAQQAFSESQRRIRAMALVHEQLYHEATMATIDFGAYVRTLMDYLRQSFTSLATQIEVVIQIDGIWLDASSAIACGLIINELASNAFKHAFPTSSSGRILVSCCRDDQGYYLLTVADTGVGLPDTQERRSGALGLKLVRTLVRQLHGQLTTTNAGGAIQTVRFASPTTGRAK